MEILIEKLLKTHVILDLQAKHWLVTYLNNAVRNSLGKYSFYFGYFNFDFMMVTISMQILFCAQNYFNLVTLKSLFNFQLPNIFIN